MAVLDAFLNTGGTDDDYEEEEEITSTEWGSLSTVEELEDDPDEAGFETASVTDPDVGSSSAPDPETTVSVDTGMFAQVNEEADGSTPTYDDVANLADRAAGNTDEAFYRSFDDEQGGGLWDGFDETAEAGFEQTVDRDDWSFQENVGGKFLQGVSSAYHGEPRSREETSADLTAAATQTQDVVNDLTDDTVVDNRATDAAVDVGDAVIGGVFKDSLKFQTGYSIDEERETDAQAGGDFALDLALAPGAVAGSRRGLRYLTSGDDAADTSRFALTNDVNRAETATDAATDANRADEADNLPQLFNRATKADDAGTTANRAETATDANRAKKAEDADDGSILGSILNRGEDAEDAGSAGNRAEKATDANRAEKATDARRFSRTRDALFGTPYRTAGTTGTTAFLGGGALVESFSDDTDGGDSGTSDDDGDGSDPFDPTDDGGDDGGDGSGSDGRDTTVILDLEIIEELARGWVLATAANVQVAPELSVEGLATNDAGIRFYVFRRVDQQTMEVMRSGPATEERQVNTDVENLPYFESEASARETYQEWLDANGGSDEESDEAAQWGDWQVQGEVGNWTLYVRHHVEDDDQQYALGATAAESGQDIWLHPGGDVEDERYAFPSMEAVQEALAAYLERLQDDEDLPEPAGPPANGPNPTGPGPSGPGPSGGLLGGVASNPLVLAGGAGVAYLAYQNYGGR